MAISQTNYIDISSSIIQAAIGNRDLSGLVISAGESVTEMSPKTVTQTDYESGKVVTLTLQGVLQTFGAASDEYKFAQRYFSYVSPSGRSPRALNFKKSSKWLNGGDAVTWDSVAGTATEEEYSGSDPVGTVVSNVTSTAGADGSYTVTVKTVKSATKLNVVVTTYGWMKNNAIVTATSEDMTPSEAFQSAIDETANFGSFTFLDGSYALSALKEAYLLNNALNFRFLAVHCEKFTAVSTHVSNAGTLGAIQSCHFCVSNDDYGAADAMAITASTNYSSTGSAVCFMYKQIAGETATVTDDATYSTLSDANINFYGQTQVNGQQLAFYQKGVNLDGTDTAVYLNEVWFKAQVITNFFNLVTSVERIPANYVGESMILTGVVIPVVATALSNGVIMLGKTLSDAQRAIIFQYTNDESAADEIQNDGYWSAITIENDGGEYKAFYRIIYAAGDSVRFVDGTHNIV